MVLHTLHEGHAANLPAGDVRLPRVDSLVDRGERIGVALRTKKRVSPVYVSPGHRMDLDSAIALTLRATGKYRQPEPTRQAHLLVNRLRQAA